jgi:hypothetical protein
MKLSTQMRSIADKLFWLTFVFFFAAMIQILNLPDGAAMWVDWPAPLRATVGVMFVLAITVMALHIGASANSALTTQRLLANGRTAEATVIDVIDTKFTVSKRPVLRIRLEVQPPGEPSFEGETEEVSYGRQLTRGSVVSVKYDPDSKSVTILDPDDVPTPSN